MIGGKNLERSSRGVILTISLWNMAECTVERPINLHPDSRCPDRDSKRVTVKCKTITDCPALGPPACAMQLAPIFVIICNTLQKLHSNLGC